MQDAADAGARLDPRVTISEATAEGVAPAFQGEGFVRPDRVPLIDGGRLVGSLVSPRTAREFGARDQRRQRLRGTGSARRWRAARSPRADAIEALGTGLYVGNLHYLNYSDRPACRMTGMTRFATFWVENGKIVAPVERAALRRHARTGCSGRTSRRSRRRPS